MNTAVDPKLMKALAHPLRQRILIELTERVASPSELAEEIGEPLGNVSYHVRMLVDLGCIELVSTTPRRGALEHHYRATVPPLFDDKTYSMIPIATRRAIVADIIKEVWQDAAAAAEANRFDEEDVHFTRHPMTLDEQGWKEVVSTLLETVERLMEINTESGERLAQAGPDAERVDSVAAIFHFKAAETKPAPRTKASKAKPKAKRKTTKR
ncbi:MAG TPA: helix-turn-helix domain-containing protein [Solirubrobacteraceae bacterium]|nr:helix-turn-helix domain-containing protein [Solirubrobacteraceae bacterium]